MARYVRDRAEDFRCEGRPVFREWLHKTAPGFSILTECGFSQILIAPFWRHGYFRHIPLLREADAALQHLAEKNDWRALTTYAYTLARR